MNSNETELSVDFMETYFQNMSWYFLEKSIVISSKDIENDILNMTGNIDSNCI